MQMKAYEYIRLQVDLGDLSALNRFGAAGWRVVAIVEAITIGPPYALLEREIHAPADPRP